MTGFDNVFIEINKFLQKTHYFGGDILCKIKYKYEFETNYTIKINVLKHNPKYDIYTWSDDWWKGQQDCHLVWATYINNINTVVVNDNNHIYEEEK